MLQSTRGPPPPLDPPNLAPFSFHSAAAAFPPPLSISLEFRMEIVFPMAEAPSPPPSPFYTLRPAVITRLKCLLMKQISSLPPSLPSGALERNGMPRRPPWMGGGK